jgi:hypothetical protein
MKFIHINDAIASFIGIFYPIVVSWGKMALVKLNLQGRAELR